jgi:hypothetical protein
VYGIRKMWPALGREGGVTDRPVARCTVARLMKAAGLRGVSEWLAQINSGEMQYHSSRPRDTSIEVTGDQAVLAGREFVHATIWGARGTWNLQLTTTYQRRDNAWIALKTVATTSDVAQTTVAERCPLSCRRITAGSGRQAVRGPTTTLPDHEATCARTGECGPRPLPMTARGDAGRRARRRSPPGARCAAPA